LSSCIGFDDVVGERVGRGIICLVGPADGTDGADAGLLQGNRFGFVRNGAMGDSTSSDKVHIRELERASWHRHITGGMNYVAIEIKGQGPIVLKLNKLSSLRELCMRKVKEGLYLHIDMFCVINTLYIPEVHRSVTWKFGHVSQQRNHKRRRIIEPFSKP
jgi:hypothetical protein